MLLTAKKKKQKPGPKTWNLTPKRLQTIYEMAKEGYNQEQIAEAVGLSRGGFIEKKKQYQSIDDILKKGRDEKGKIDIKRVEPALMQRCLGSEYDEVTIEERTVHGRKQIDKKVVAKHIQPSDTAIIFFLCNRAPDTWVSLNKDQEKAMGDIGDALKMLAENVIKADSWGRNRKERGPEFATKIRQKKAEGKGKN